MTERLFIQDKDGLLHEVKTTEGNVTMNDMNLAISKYYPDGAPVDKLKLLDVTNPEGDEE